MEVGSIIAYSGWTWEIRLLIGTETPVGGARFRTERDVGQFVILRRLTDGKRIIVTDTALDYATERLCSYCETPCDAPDIRCACGYGAHYRCLVGCAKLAPNFQHWNCLLYTQRSSRFGQDRVEMLRPVEGWPDGWHWCSSPAWKEPQRAWCQDPRGS